MILVIVLTAVFVLVPEAKAPVVDFVCAPSAAVKVKGVE